MGPRRAGEAQSTITEVWDHKASHWVTEPSRLMEGLAKTIDGEYAPVAAFADAELSCIQGTITAALIQREGKVSEAICHVYFCYIVTGFHSS